MGGIGELGETAGGERMVTEWVVWREMGGKGWNGERQKSGEKKSKMGVR